MRPPPPRQPHARRLGPIRWTLRRRLPGRTAQAQACDWLVDELETSAPALWRDRYGRPHLDAGPTSSRLDVNWSHSGDHLLIALARQARVGADLERIRPRPRALELAQRFFHPGEHAWLQARPMAEQELAFIRLWCAKEALLKAHGRGIAFGLGRFQIALPDAGPPRLLEADPALGPVAAWRLYELQPRPGYHASLAWCQIDPAPCPR